MPSRRSRNPDSQLRRCPSAGQGPPAKRVRSNTCCTTPTAPIASLPVEVVTAVFAYVTGTDAAPFATLSLTHVCHQWRQLVSATPQLWRNAQQVPLRLPAQPSEPFATDAATGDGKDHGRGAAHRQSSSALTLLKLYSRRSKGTLTHANLPSLPADGRDWRRWLAILADSAPTLHDLRFEDGVCPSPVWPACDVHHQRALRPVSPTLFNFIATACTLERLTLHLKCWRSAILDVTGLSKDVILPKPKAVTVLFGQSCEAYIPFTAIRAALGHLTSETEHLIFHSDEWHASWQSWAWDTMLSRAQHLRTCQLRASLCELARVAVVELPHMEEMAVYGVEECRLSPLVEDAPRTIFEAPQLRRLRASPAMAAKFSCPGLEAVSLVFAHKRDIDAFRQLCHARPSITTLTIEIDAINIGCSCWRKETPAVILLSILATLAVGAGGAMPLPNLRHLGILYAGLTQSSDVIAQAMEWAAVAQWTQRECQQYAEASPQKGRWPALPLVVAKLLLSIDAQRSTPCPPFVAPTVCHNVNAVPRASHNGLETVKLGGLRMGPTMWRSLLQGLSARFICLPPTDSAYSSSTYST